MGMRDYGGVNPHSQGEVGVPRVVGYPDDARLTCPNCKCGSLASIEVEITNIAKEKLMGTLLRGVAHSGEALGSYLGCPACPWASPMMMVAKGKTNA
jgi:hypothetical protein